MSLTSKHVNHPRHLYNGNKAAVYPHITIKQNHARTIKIILFPVESAERKAIIK